MTGAEVVFWGSVTLLVYPYAIYPVLMFILGCVRPRPVRRAPCEPTVSVLIAAYNEGDCIGATIENKLEQRYPAGKLQLIVVSDGSTDGTDDIVRRYAPRGVQLVRREGRQGKAAALNEAIRHARGEIVVFSDANSLFAPDAIARMVENFADPQVGYVTGCLSLAAPGGSIAGTGSSTVLSYEDLIRAVETRAGSVIGVNGGVDAIRRSLYTDIPPGLITDFVLPLSVAAGGYRVVSDRAVRSHEAANARLAPEFRMRVRVALRALQGMRYMRRLLNPVRYPLLSFCLVSHKLLRYVGFVFLFGALAASGALAPHSTLYATLFGAQIAVYAVAGGALAGIPLGALSRAAVLPAYLMTSYAAFAMATFKFLRGDSMATWQPRAG